MLLYLLINYFVIKDMLRYVIRENKILTVTQKCQICQQCQPCQQRLYSAFLFRSFEQNLDELKGIEDSLLYETLKVLVVAMKISGIFFVKKKGSFGQSLKEKLRSLTALQVRTNVYVITLFRGMIHGRAHS